MIIPEAIEYVNGTYHFSQDVNQLTDGVNRLNDIILNQQPRQNFKQKAEALSYRLNAKICAIKYFDGGYLEEDYIALKETLTDLVAKSEQNGYAKTTELLQAVLSVAGVVRIAMEGAESEIYRVQDEEGNPTTTDKAELKAFAENFRRRASCLDALPDTANLFGERVKMKDVKACAVQDLLGFALWAEKAIEDQECRISEEFFKENLSALDDQSGLKFFDYFPAVPDKEKNTARTLVIMSPFDDEIILFARAVAKEKAIKFFIFNAQAFINQNEDAVCAIFKGLKARNVNLIIDGLSEYNAQNKRTIIENALLYSKSHGEVILIDNKGDKNVYDLAYEICKENEALSTTDVLYKYLTMPNYNFVVSELEERGMINGGEYSYVQNNLAFMGYVGLNTACSLFVQGREWKDTAKEISIAHESDCQTYLRRLPSQSQLIDIGWKRLQTGRNVVDKKGEFDYDSIKDVNVKNIKKILEHNSTLFAKCGLIVKYCLLAGDDVSAWKRVERKEREERVNNATRLVAHMLNCENDPEVRIIPKDEWTEKGAGGLCCDGGKRIIYREDCCDDVDWLVDAICHECYHSFQRTLQHQGWQEWHWSELGITEYRVPEWDYNFDKYKSSGESYRIQVVESDARTFAKDCIMQGEERWHLIDWE